MIESKLKYRKNQGPSIDYSFSTYKRKQFYMCKKQGEKYSKDSNEGPSGLASCPTTIDVSIFCSIVSLVLVSLETSLSL
jgi:hypothetical protein